MVSEKKDATGHTLLRVHQSYDAAGQLVGQSWYVGTTYYAESYSYNVADGSLNAMVAGTGETLQFTYDDLQRLTSVNNSLYTRNYSYRNLSDTATTTQVSQVQYNIGSANLTYGYTYDAMGNIATYTAPGKSTVTYTYDALGQLVSAVGDETYTYTYDSAGNLLTANGHTYTYGAPGWPDVLFKFDGQTITFDTNANPLSYYNGTRWNFTWENGRSLATATDGTTSISYAYDADGLRTAKTVGSVTHKYLYAGGQLLRESYGNNILDFFYDANGYPYALKYNGTTYYYITNLQGDVMYLVDAQGNTVATYDYDPYGNIISATGTMAEVNPLRYRGYYYDADLKMYYLQSRYYDPAIGRFLNADVYASTGQGVIGFNMFAYCGNNPVVNRDSSGTSPIAALGLADYAIIHKIVQLLCAATYGWELEVYVKEGIRRGYLDLYDKKTGVYYEVKSYNSAKSWHTNQQMLKYDKSKIKDKRYEGTNIYNKTLARGKQHVDGTFAYGVYDISYYLYSEGLIAYKTKRNWNRSIAVAAGLFAVLMLATGNIPGAAGLGAAIPVFA